MTNELTIINEASNSPLIQKLLPIKLINLECKHIENVNNNTVELHQNAIDVGYDNDIIGSHRSYTNIFDELARISNMSKTSCLRAVRIVVTKDGRIWSDNTHWTISYIIRYGKDTQLQKIPFYVVDFRMNSPIIFNYASTLYDSMTEIERAVEAAQNIQSRLNNGWRKNGLSYTIGDLFSALLNIEQLKREI